MGALRDIIKQLRNRTAEEDPEEIEKNAKAGQNDADKIAKRMGQDKPSFMEHIDVAPPVEIPIEPEKGEHSRDDGAR